MQFILAALATIALVNAQALPPACALTCIASAETGDCGATDNACLCKNQPFIDSTTACIRTSCTNPDDFEQATAAARALCEAVGVTITTPAATGSTTGTGTGTGAPSTTASVPSTTNSAPAATSPTSQSTGAAMPNTVASLSGVAGVFAALVMAL